MADDLRDKITEAIDTHRWTTTVNIGPHSRHGYHSLCKICTGDVAAIADAVLSVVTAELERLRADRIISCVFAVRSGECPLPFALYRRTDETGVSGEGTVAYGVQFADGTVVIRWLGDYASTVVWDSLDKAMQVHGHRGSTRVVWLAEQFEDLAEIEAKAERAEQAEKETARLGGLTPLPRTEFREKFWERVNRGEGCWEWQGRRQHNGYGRLWVVDTKSEQAAHRVAWQVTYGFIPDGIQVCHRCDNPPCCNPDHLFLGTKHDNMQDCAGKGRNVMQQKPELSSLARPRNPEHQVRGERQGSSKLTADQVRAIRAMRASGRPSSEIAARFGISAGHVRKVSAGRAWAHITLDHSVLATPTEGATDE
jgi:HNH endonuclease